jgi:exosome complex RNA-binding protein Rrp42 (RNase PH superfamily)
MQRGAPPVVSANERAFLLGALAEGLRADGRAFFDPRAPRLRLGPAAGAAELELGGTRVLASVSAELVEPFPDRPSEGSFALSVELSPMASAAFEPGRPSPAAVELGRVLERAIVKSHAVDLEALCVLPARHVWAVRCDVTVLDDCGNLTDACTLAAAAAVRHFRKPFVRVRRADDGEAATVEVCAPDVEEPEPLSLRHMPLAFTFALVLSDEAGGAPPHLILDPTEREEAVACGSICVMLNRQGELCALHKAGGAALERAQIGECTKVAAGRFDALLAALDAALAAQPPALATVAPRPGCA